MTADQILDPFGATNEHARLAAWEQLAGQGPITRITMPTGLRAWLVTGYAEVRAARNDAWAPPWPGLRRGSPSAP